MPETVSDAHVYAFLKRERQMEERLKTEMGGGLVGKLDRLLLRDLIHERRDRDLNAAFGDFEPSQRRYTVMINMRPSQMSQPARRSTKHSDEGRQVILDRMMHSASLTLDRLEANLRQLDAEVRERYWLTHSIVADLTSEQIERIALREDVLSITAVKLQAVMCLDVSRPLIGADQVENQLGISGKGINVAVIDTGVDASHPALEGVVVSQQDFTGEGIGDNVGHGTHCAGIIASQDRTRRGIAPGVQSWDF
ncbi:MAG: S8 family serine peptidase, partial [Candidatus Methanoperedens sp.]|nr:S8 family serine peptidase [Candidatus Methanoperedens sp.]